MKNELFVTMHVYEIPITLKLFIRHKNYIEIYELIHHSIIVIVIIVMISDHEVAQ